MLEPDWPTISGATGLVTAIAALFVAVWEAKVSRRHNRLSVKPLLRLDCRFSNEPPSMTLVNTGVGPAIITSFAVLVDGVVIGREATHPMSLALTKLAMPCECYMYTPHTQEAMSPGEKQTVLKCVETVGEPFDRDAIVGLLARLTLRVRYRSIYGELSVLNEGWRQNTLAQEQED